MAHIIVIVPNKEITMNEAVDNAIEAIPNCEANLDGVIYYR